MIPSTLGVELSAHLSKKYLTHVVAPTDTAAVIARTLISALGTLVPVTHGVADAIIGEAEHITVTLPTPFGTVILLSPMAVADPLEYAATIAHEHQHAVQIAAAGGVQASIDYLGSGELRARAEADAYAVGVCVKWLVTGSLPSLDEAVAPEASGLYHLDAGEIALARGVLASHLASMASGSLPPISVAVEVHRWLAATHPGLIAVAVS